jgi:hypothetical protein
VNTTTSRSAIPSRNASLAEQHRGKVIAAGDTEQLQAVQNGGGMSLLADRLGYARLAEPVRFRAPWERAASLRLRDSDPTVAGEYDQHGRITGGATEEMTEAAAAHYITLAAGGTDVLLIAADHTLRRELSRRVRENLLRLGLVDDTQTVTIADGTTAGIGDLILCIRNDYQTEAGEPGRTLANGDLLHIKVITSQGPLVRRALSADHKTGQRRWTNRHFLYANFQDAELGYAVTGHVAQGRTVHTGLELGTTNSLPKSLSARAYLPSPKRRAKAVPALSSRLQPITAGQPYCNRPSPRSLCRHGSWDASQAGIWATKLAGDS